MAKKANPFNPLLAAKNRDKRAESAPSTPNTPKSNSTGLSVTSQTLSPPNDSKVPVKEHVRQPPQSRNINDPSYQRNAPKEPPSNRIADQMQVAKNDPQYPEKKQGNIDARKKAREEFTQTRRNGFNPLRTQQETGVTSTFQSASQIQHRIQRDTQGRILNQETGRPTKLALNQRPSQRVHKTDK